MSRGPNRALSIVQNFQADRSRKHPSKTPMPVSGHYDQIDAVIAGASLDAFGCLATLDQTMNRYAFEASGRERFESMVSMLDKPFANLTFAIARPDPKF